MINTPKYPNNHYELLLQNNATKKIFHLDGNDVSDSKLFVKLDNFNLEDEYEIINDGTAEVTKEKLSSGEYSYALFWNTLDISYSIEPSNVLLDTKIIIHNDDGTDQVVFLKDLRPDIGLAKLVRPEDKEQYIEEIEDHTLKKEDIYYSLE